jgi:hypothetical protein
LRRGEAWSMNFDELVRKRKPDTEVDEVTLPPIIDKAAYQAPAHTHIAELHKRGVRRRRQARASFMNSIEQTSAILFDLMVT